VDFTPDFVTISDVHDNSIIVGGDINHQYRSYNFNKFIAKFDYDLLLMHVNDISRL
jgi:hypothetical protein